MQEVPILKGFLGGHLGMQKLKSFDGRLVPAKSRAMLPDTLGGPDVGQGSLVVHLPMGSLAVVLAAVDVVSLVATAPSWWSGILAVQEKWSPFNVVHFTAELIFLSPAIGAFIWQERRRERNRKLPLDAKTKAAERLEELEADTPRILREYLSLHESFPGCVIDASSLPLCKDEMTL